MRSSESHQFRGVPIPARRRRTSPLLIILARNTRQNHTGDIRILPGTSSKYVLLSSRPRILGSSDGSQCSVGRAVAYLRGCSSRFKAPECVCHDGDREAEERGKMRSRGQRIVRSLESCERRPLDRRWVGKEDRRSRHTGQ
jgi:hypothetical protein